MRLPLDEVHQCLFLLGRHVLLVALHQREQALVPQHGEGAGLKQEPAGVGGARGKDSTGMLEAKTYPCS